MTMAEGKTTARVEEYLESIFNMLSEGSKVLAARLAERLEVTPPTVTTALRRMARDGLVTVDRHKEVSLTQKGYHIAQAVVRRHRMLERLLTDVLGVEWYLAHQEACLLEHGISAQVEGKLFQALGQPTTCPHGNPIPGDDVMPTLKGIPLDAAAEGTEAVVERISEAAERNPKLMEYLFRNNFVPGAHFKVKEMATYAGTVVLSREGQDFPLSLHVAKMIWVTRALT